MLALTPLASSAVLIFGKRDVPIGCDDVQDRRALPLYDVQATVAA